MSENSKIEWCDATVKSPIRLRLKDKKGGTMSEWPEDFKVRQFPA